MSVWSPLAFFGKSAASPGEKPAEPADKLAAPPPVPELPLLPPINPHVNSLLEHGDIIDLTKLAARQTPVPCYGRDDDIQWIAIRVASPQKNGILFVGPAGVGKTRLYYHIAHLVSAGKAPFGLRGRRIFLLQGHGPKHVLSILDQHYSNQCVLIADEVHSILISKGGWMGIGGGQDLSPELKPFIGSGKTPFIGLTDRPDEFMKDPAWVRRFHVRELEEMSIPSTIEAITASKQFLEDTIQKQIAQDGRGPEIHVEITPEAIAMAVKLSVIFLPKEYLPDKPSKILEPACIAKVMCVLRQGAEQGKSHVVTITEKDITKYAQKEYRMDRHALSEKLADLENSLLNSPIPLTEPLMRHTTNLTERARRKLLMPAYGREEELKKVTTVLSALESNNVILRGFAGAGKSRIGEGLAVNIVNKNVPRSLENVQVLLLDLNSLIGDTKYRGELESKLSEFLKSAEKYSDYFILIVDELHRLIGAGRTKDSSDDAANQFKDLLGRGKLRMLGMTTPTEFRFLESDPAFLRRFQIHDVEPFSVMQTIEVITADKEHFQHRYSERMKLKFTIEPSACVAAAHLAVQYLPKEYLPASGYKIFHGACAFAQAQAAVDQSSVTVNIDTVIDYINYFYKKEKNEKTRRQVENDLKRLQAELHPSNQLIPLHEPLIQLTENWTNKARQGLFKPSVHREVAAQRIFETLNCKTSNNVLLLGRAGSGKTSLAQQVAIMMADGQINGPFKDRLFLALKLQDLLDLARTSPNTISLFIESLRRCAGNFVLFIDEFHIFFQVHTRDGIPLHELFKPILADGKVHLIGASTHEEAQAFILNKGEAILRRFAIHDLPELSDVESIDAIASSKEAYETHYTEHLGQKIVIDPDAFKTAVEEAKTRLLHQALPSSAITLFEGACSAKTLDESLEESKVTSADILRFAEERYPLPKPTPSFSWMNRIYRLFASFFGFFFR